MAPTAAEQQIIDLEEERYRAMLDGDAAALDRLCWDELVYTHSNSDRDSKASYLEKVKSGHFTYHWIEHPVETLQVGPDWAIITGQMRAHVTNNGEERHLNNACLAVWAKVDGEWKFAAYQPTPNPA